MTHNTDRRLHWTVPALSFLAAVALFASTGCQRFPGSQAMRQYQLESDRLLAEYRAQKKRADDLEVSNANWKQRTAEAEKLLALTLGGSKNRSTASNSGGNRYDSELTIGDARGENALSEAKSSRSSTRGPVKINQGGLPDVRPSTSGHLTSGNRTDPMSLGNGPRDLKGDPKSESQWRPVNRGK